MIKTVLINYDYNTAPMGTAFYIERALIQLGITPVRYINKELDYFKLLKIQAIINIDSCDKVVTHPDIPSAFWFTDSYRPTTKSVEEINSADCLFVGSNPRDIEKFPKAKWLPFAADLEIHKRQDTPVDQDVVFIGLVAYPDRERYLKFLKELPIKVSIGNSAPGFEYARSSSRGKLIFNCSNSYDINMRVFEAMNIGCLFTNYIPEMDQLGMEPHVHYVPYNSDKSFLDNLKKYLADDEAREKIIKNGRQLIQQKHTYKHRAQVILDALEVFLK